MGYHRAGFEVVGVDIKPQPHYPFAFYQEDALLLLSEGAWRLRGGPFSHVEAIHASPPCQNGSRLRSLWPDRHYPDLLTPTRAALADISIPWVIENVPGQPGPWDVMLCGTQFGLDVIRHRYFQVNWGPLPLVGFCCVHDGDEVTLTGHSANPARQGAGGKSEHLTIDRSRAAMGVDWMTRDELSQAIPPAYTEWVGKQLLAHIEVAA